MTLRNAISPSRQRQSSDSLQENQGSHDGQVDEDSVEESTVDKITNNEGTNDRGTSNGSTAHDSTTNEATGKGIEHPSADPYPSPLPSSQPSTSSVRLRRSSSPQDSHGPHKLSPAKLAALRQQLNLKPLTPRDAYEGAAAINRDRRRHQRRSAVSLGSEERERAMTGKFVDFHSSHTSS